MEKKTHTNLFTAEQIVELGHNPYIRNISEATISFTEDFKKIFLNHMNKGESVFQIFKDYGIDPAILGEKRVSGFAYTLRKKAESGLDFKDNRKLNGRIASNESDSLELRIKQLEHELAYTKQEVEFLKKIQMADMEAHRQWESKHRLK